MTNSASLKTRETKRKSIKRATTCTTILKNGRDCPKNSKNSERIGAGKQAQRFDWVFQSLLNIKIDLETKILTEQKKQMARNAFLGKHNREEYAKIDEALQIAKKDLIQTEASLKERQNEIKAKERQHLQAKMKLKLTHQRQNRGKKEKTKGKKKKNANNQAAAEASQTQTPVSTTA